MLRRPIASLLLAGFFFPGGGACPVTAQSKKQPPVWNYDGGIVMMSDGSLPDGPCFRISGKLTAPDFFDGLKRLDSNSGVVYRRGNDVVTHFPSALHLIFEMYDHPCSDNIQATGPRTYLTAAMMETLRVSFFWKRGMQLRPAAGIQSKNFYARPIAPYATDLAKELPEKFEWWFEFDVPSEGVPLTDSLVIILRSTDQHDRIAARLAARM